MPSSPSVHFLTLGCPKNEVDSDRMKAIVSASFETTDEIDDADVVVINTCSFIRDAVEESIDTVLDVANSWLTCRADRHLVVAGCMVSRYGDELAASLPEASALISVADESNIARVLGELTGVTTQDNAHPVRTPQGPAAYLQVSDGCHRTCSFCTIPSIRGPYRSRPLTDLISEAELLVASGARELTLIGQDISAWGLDLGGKSRLHDVVREIASVEGLEWLRLMYVQPDGVTDDLLHVMAEEPAVCEYLDIPLQHASGTVLRRMHRTGDAEQFERLIAHIRSIMPGVALRTSVIAGFPGETRSEARVLEDFLDEIQFDYVGVFTYSPEDGTAAALQSDQVPLRTRRSRAQRLRDLADTIGFERAASRIGQTLEVLIDSEEEGRPVGRWKGQAPEVDGVVLLDSGQIGDMVTALVVDSVAYDLEAEVVA